MNVKPETLAEIRRITDTKLSLLKQVIEQRRYQGPGEKQLSFFEEGMIGG